MAYNCKVVFLIDRTTLWQEFMMHHAIAIEKISETKPSHLTELNALFSVLTLLEASMLVREFLAKNKIGIMPQPPYAPDLAPADFLLFPKLKIPMKVKRFATIEEIKEKSKQELLEIPKIALQKCFEDCKDASISVLYLRGVTLKGTR